MKSSEPLTEVVQVRYSKQQLKTLNMISYLEDKCLSTLVREVTTEKYPSKKE